MKITMMRRGDVSSTTSLEMPSGTFVELTDPHPDDLLLEDIAHNLAAETRYGGSCNMRYTVAEHAVLVARFMRSEGANPVAVFVGLHHDDPEALLKDIPRPLKRIIGPRGYDDLEALMYERIRIALCLDRADADGAMHRVDPKSPEVKGADEWALGLEARALLPSGGTGWAPPWEGSRTAARVMLQSVAVGGGAAAGEQYLAEHRLCLHHLERWRSR